MLMLVYVPLKNQWVESSSSISNLISPIKSTQTLKWVILFRFVVIIAESLYAASFLKRDFIKEEPKSNDQ